MKKILFAFALFFPLFTGCLRDVDWYPVELRFYIQDKDGNDLLDPSSESFIGDEISLMFNGEDYSYSLWADTKTYMPVFRGFDIRKESSTGKYCVTFGELDGGCDRSDDFVLRFPDGSSKTIHYDRKINHISISARQQWYLDGDKVEFPISIVF